MSIIINHITKSIVRPVITLGLLSMWLLLIWFGREYPKELQWLTIAVTLEWFGERALLRLRDLLK